MTNTIDSREACIELTREAIATVERYGFEPSETFDGWRRIEDGGVVVFRVLNDHIAAVEVRVIPIAGGVTLTELSARDYVGHRDPDADYLDDLDEVVTRYFRSLK